MASPSRAAALLLRRYETAECGSDGYPLAWRAPSGSYLPRIPDLVRDLAGHRCARCLHPYRTGQTEPEWSPCDTRCVHEGPLRVGSEETAFADLEKPAMAAGMLLEVMEVKVVLAKWRVLTVHHLTGEKADCRWWNLAALCQRCHLYVQGRVRMDQVYPYAHTPWFRPYAAGYYAAVYLGQDISRAEAAEREDELLALERVA